MRVVRSNHAHGRIVSIDTSAAKALPGVVDVWTADDIPEIGPIDFREGTIEKLAPSIRIVDVLLGQGLLMVTMTDGSTPVIREGEALFAGDAAVAEWRNLADDPAIGFWVGV